MKFSLKTTTDRAMAAFLFILFMELSVAIALGISCMYDYHFYSSDYRTYAVQAAFEVKSGAQLDDIADYAELTMRSARAPLNGMQQSKLDAYAAAFSPSATNAHFTVCAGDSVLLTNAASEDETFAYQRFETRTVYSETGTPITITIRLGVQSDLAAHDVYRTVASIIRLAISVRYILIALLVVTVIFALLILGALMSSVEITDADGREKRPGFIDRIPLDLLILMLMLVFGFFGVLVELTAIADVKRTNIVLWNAIILIIAFFLIVVSMAFNLSVASRIKRGHVYRNTVVFRAIARIRKIAGKENDGYFKVPFIGKAMLTVGLAVLTELVVLLVFIYSYYTNESGLLRDFHFPYYVIFWAAGRFILIPVFFMMALNLNHLRENGERLAQGDYQFDVDSHIMFGDFRQINANLNQIQSEMMQAAEEKNRSYRLRSELITNISHDIKTPLTSIVSFVDLLRSTTDPQQAQEYMDILQSQSVRLKGLLESLIEVSRLTTGDIAVQMEQLDAVLFAQQCASEFADRLEAAGLELVERYADERIMICADGGKLWRVFENLFGNILKYARPDSRVYLDIGSAQDGRVTISFRNIAKDRINMSGEELTHRFARADSSRHSEGYGLGLSIAQSLTQIQNGTMDVTVDGDLFRVDLTFAAAD